MDSAVATPTRLRTALDAAGLSVRELALATGLRERSLYRYLAGERLSLEAMDFSDVRGAHQEIELVFE